MVAPLRRLGTLADLAALPDDVVGELIAGEIFASPRPRPRHARAAHRIGADLDGPFDRGRDGPGGWLFLPEPELHLGYRLERTNWLRVGTWADDAIARVPPFAEVELSLAGWWL